MKQKIRRKVNSNLLDAPVHSLAHHEYPFPIVGIGASAGGLEALELLLTALPIDSGVAFVIVQHLDPTHKGMMPEILQRITSIKVDQVQDQMEVKPNHIYVIPPNKDISLLHGKLHLFDPMHARGLRLPIDFFFHSLASELRQQSIGVILSGMGSDGTQGLHSIKERGGLVIVQDPKEAKYDSMPNSAIDSGIVDIIALAQLIPEKISLYLHHPKSSVIQEPANIMVLKASGSLSKIIILLRTHTGQDFSQYKESTICRRIERRMGLHQLVKIADYERYLRDNPQEIELLFKELLIGVTDFFRDPAVWRSFSEHALEPMITSEPGDKDYRAWVVGCSTGEEAYSLAISFCEAVEKIKPKNRFTLQIFATDLDPNAVEKARQGYYPSSIKDKLSSDRIATFFQQEGKGYRVRKNIREMIVFAQQNVISDPPFTKLDMLCCRNLLIYFNSELQQKLLPPVSLLPQSQSHAISR